MAWRWRGTFGRTHSIGNLIEPQESQGYKGFFGLDYQLQTLCFSVSSSRKSTYCHILIPFPKVGFNSREASILYSLQELFIMHGVDR
jgi:hypothetical protein